MARYVVLNLADPEIGPSANVQHGLEARAKNKPRTVGVGDDTVPMHDLFEMLEAAKDDYEADLGPDLDKVRNDCDSAEKIFLCTHGTATDTEHGFGHASGGGALASWKGFGRLIRQILPRKDRPYNVALVMCYGARTDDYYARDLDHQGMIPSDKLKTSFAYKFFKYLCHTHDRNIRMTARTGAVGFDYNTGQSTVEQEASVDVRLELEEYLRQPKILAVIDRWKRFKEEAIQEAKDGDETKLNKWSKVNEKYRDKPGAYGSPFSPIKLAGKAYHQMIARKNKLEDRQHGYRDLRKYGKIVYEVEGGGVKITNKYGSDDGVGPNTVLYDGPWL